MIDLAIGEQAVADTVPDPLGTVLNEFHEWMFEHEPRYDPAAEFEEDREALTGDGPGWAWLGRVRGEPVGCVMLVEATPTIAAVRRLWVRPAARGHGVGGALLDTVLDRARVEEYETLALTVPPWGEAAIALYESRGFERTAPYPGTRLPDKFHEVAIFMRRDLKPD